MKRIIVVGAGASGLMSAFYAKNENTSVTILEALEKPGRKLLATGNGRCNLTYASGKPLISYRGGHPQFPDDVLSAFSQKDTRQFFEEHGMLMHEKNQGIYPYTDQAQTVLGLLMDAVQEKGVKIKTRERVTKILKKKEKEGQSFLVVTEGWKYEADAVILACGSKAAVSLGATDDGYLLAKDLGHRITPLFPALVPLKTKETRFQALSGLRSTAKVMLMLDGKKAAESFGELQWTSYGISGIVVFQVSRFAAEGLYLGKQVQAVVNLLSDQDIHMISRILGNQKKRADRIFLGLFPQKIASLLLELSGYRPSDILMEEQIYRVLDMACHLTMHVTGTRSFEYAQVCAGGVDTSEIDSRTLESRKVSGIYFAGELLDVDGACGGYNLQWAWSSGFVAGTHAAEQEMGKQEE